MKEVSRQRTLGKRALKVAFLASPFAFSKTHRQHAFRVTYLASGEPAIEGVPCHASIAHTLGWAVGAVANHAIGVDIECVRKRRDVPELLRYIASPTEQGITQLHTTEPARALTLLWVVKESVRKCLGIRRPIAPKELVIYKRSGGAFFVRWKKNNARYKAYVTEERNILMTRALPLHVKEHMTYRVIHTHANVRI